MNSPCALGVLLFVLLGGTPVFAVETTAADTLSDQTLAYLTDSQHGRIGGSNPANRAGACFCRSSSPSTGATPLELFGSDSGEI